MAKLMTENEWAQDSLNRSRSQVSLAMQGKDFKPLPVFVGEEDDPAFWGEPLSIFPATPWLSDKECILHKTNYRLMRPNVCYNVRCGGCNMPEGRCIHFNHTGHCDSSIVDKPVNSDRANTKCLWTDTGITYSKRVRL